MCVCVCVCVCVFLFRFFYDYLAKKFRGLASQVPKWLPDRQCWSLADGVVRIGIAHPRACGGCQYAKVVAASAGCWVCASDARVKDTVQAERAKNHVTPW